MGACVSVHENPDSNIKLRLPSGCKTENLVISSSVKDKPQVNGDHPMDEGVLKSQWSTSHPATTVRDFGSKEETFFDSQAWLESDCEDDFVSVNGDFTPSRSSTSSRHSFSAATQPRLIEALFDVRTQDDKLKPSPKKVLSELFRDSFERNKEVDDRNVMDGSEIGLDGNIEPEKPVLGLPQRSANSTPFAYGTNSVCSSDRTSDIPDYRIEKEKTMKFMQCCLPKMLSSRSFSGRRKSSPARSVV